MPAVTYRPIGTVTRQWTAPEGTGFGASTTELWLCADCGAVVGDVAAHDDFHGEGA